MESKSIKISAGTRDISPDWPLALGGYRERFAFAEPHPGTLEANVLAFRDAAGKTALIVSLDTLFAGAPLCTAVEEHVAHAHGVPRTNILIAASHTHFAPMLDPSKPVLGAVDPEYLAFAIRQVCELVDDAMKQPLTPAFCGRGRRSAPFNVNRRLPWPIPHLVGGRVTLGPVNASYPAGACDSGIECLRFEDSSGLVRAVIVRYSCHAVAWPGTSPSADYVGELRAAIRASQGPVPVIFLQGFAGDIRPLGPPKSLRPPESYAQRLSRLIRALPYGPMNVPHTPQSYSLWAGAIARKAVDASVAGEARPLAGNVRSAYTSVPLTAIARIGPSNRSVEFRRLMVGDDIDVIAVGAEPVVELYDLVPFANALLVGYVGDVFGYWPRDAQVLEGGYEADGFRTAFALPGPLIPNLDTVFRQAVERLR